MNTNAGAPLFSRGVRGQKPTATPGMACGGERRVVKNRQQCWNEGRGGERRRRLGCNRRRSRAAAHSKSRQTRSYFFSRTRRRFRIPQQLRSNKHAARGHQHAADASRRRLDLGQFLPQLSGGARTQTRHVSGAGWEPAAKPAAAGCCSLVHSVLGAL